MSANFLFRNKGPGMEEKAEGFSLIADIEIEKPTSLRIPSGKLDSG